MELKIAGVTSMTSLFLKAIAIFDLTNFCSTVIGNKCEVFEEDNTPGPKKYPLIVCLFIQVG